MSRIFITKDQHKQLAQLNADWDSITTVEGVLRYQQILGVKDPKKLLDAASQGKKVEMVVRKGPTEK